MANKPTCERCGQPLTRSERPWTADTVNGVFRSNWTNPFGFPWCPGEGDLLPHTPVGIDEEEGS